MRKNSANYYRDGVIETPPQKDVPPINWPGQPERICGNCEHFDGGGRGAAKAGDCHNGISGKFTTYANAPACLRGWFPCTTRWPLEIWPKD